MTGFNGAGHGGTGDRRFRRYRDSRSQHLRDAMFADHLPLARALARRYSYAGIDDDLLQVAGLGLLKAIERFDPDRGFRFASFAIPTITGEIKRHFRDTSWAVHVPRRVRDLDGQIEAASGRLLQRLGRQPDLDEIAAELRVAVEEVIETVAARACRRSVALERLDADPTAALDRDLEQLEDSVLLARAIGRLDKRSQLLLRLRFFDDLTQRQIAELIDVSQVHVSRLLARALETLHRELTCQLDSPADILRSGSRPDRRHSGVSRIAPPHQVPRLRRPTD